MEINFLGGLLLSLSLSPLHTTHANPLISLSTYMLMPLLSIDAIGPTRAATCELGEHAALLAPRTTFDFAPPPTATAAAAGDGPVGPEGAAAAAGVDAAGGVGLPFSSAALMLDIDRPGESAFFTPPRLDLPPASFQPSTSPLATALVFRPLPTAPRAAASTDEQPLLEPLLTDDGEDAKRSPLEEENPVEGTTNIFPSNKNTKF